MCEQLERLGHEVTVFAEEPAGEAPGLRVVNAERGLPLAPDVIYAQDAYAALMLAELFRSRRRCSRSTATRTSSGCSRSSPAGSPA